MNFSLLYRALVTSCVIVFICTLIYLQQKHLPSIFGLTYNSVQRSIKTSHMTSHVTSEKNASFLSVLNETLASELIGQIWPASDEKIDRIRSQIDFQQTYNGWKKQHGGFLKTKVWLCNQQSLCVFKNLFKNSIAKKSLCC